MLALQRSAGNAAVARILSADRPLVSREVIVENIDYEPPKIQGQPGTFHRSHIEIPQIERRLKDSNFWTALATNEIERFRGMDAARPRPTGEDVPSLATAIINYVAGGRAARVIALGQHRAELEQALGTAAPAEVSEREAGAFHRIRSAATSMSRSKGVASVVDPGKLLAESKGFLDNFAARLVARHKELGQVQLYPGLDPGLRDPLQRAGYALGVRSPHLNRARWLPDREAPVGEPQLDLSAAQWASNLAQTGDAGERNEIQRAFGVDPAPTGLEVESSWLTPKLKRRYLHEVFHDAVPGKAAKVRLAWARYAKAYGAPACPYIEFDGGAGIARIIYDYVNDAFYISSHYNWVDGYNPFFRVDGMTAL